MLKMFNMTKSERAEIGKRGRDHVLKNYGFADYTKKWDETFQHVRNELGSWENRKNYKSWEFKEVA